MTETKKAFASYSQYIKWFNCGWSWKLEYVDGHKQPKNVFLIFGTAMHNTIQAWRQAVHDRVPMATPLHDLLFTNLASEFKACSYIDKDGKTVYICDRLTLQEFYRHGVEILDYLVLNEAKLFPQHWILLGIEIPLEVDIKPMVTFTGYMDVVLKNVLTGQVKILDIKTSTKGWGRYQKGDRAKLGQLLLYKYFYSKVFKVPFEFVQVEYVILTRIPQFAKQVETFIPPQDRESVKNIVTSFMQYVDECFNDDGTKKSDLKATPSEKACKFCQYAVDGKCEFSFFKRGKQHAISR